MLSSQGIADLANDEGVVFKAYRCPAGVLTIGVGHTSAAGAPKVTPGMMITRSEAMAILGRDLARFEVRVVRAMGAGIAQTVRDGGTSFDFNTGAIDRASWVGKWKAGRYAAAEASLKSWNRGGGRVLKGLVRRRAREADLIFRGRYVSAPANSAESTERDEIASYQDALRKLGDYKGAVDGIRGLATAEAVVAFQRRRGLTPDGIVGPATRAELTRALQEAASVKTSAGGGVLGGAGGAGSELTTAPPAVEPTSADPTALDPSALPDVTSDAVIEALIWAGIAGAAIWVGFWAWRNRGPLFAWLPEPVKDAAAQLGITIGRRVAT